MKQTSPRKLISAPKVGAGYTVRVYYDVNIDDPTLFYFPTLKEAQSYAKAVRIEGISAVSILKPIQ